MWKKEKEENTKILDKAAGVILRASWKRSCYYIAAKIVISFSANLYHNTLSATRAHMRSQKWKKG